jgi:hypothetical protein
MTKDLVERMKRQVNVWATDGEYSLLKSASQAENFRTLSPWLRKLGLDRAKKVLGNVTPTVSPTVAQREGETPCANTQNTDTPCVNDAPNQSKGWPN